MARTGRAPVPDVHAVDSNPRSASRTPPSSIDERGPAPAPRVPERLLGEDEVPRLVAQAPLHDGARGVAHAAEREAPEGGRDGLAAEERLDGFVRDAVYERRLAAAAPPRAAAVAVNAAARARWMSVPLSRRSGSSRSGRSAARVEDLRRRTPGRRRSRNARGRHRERAVIRRRFRRRGRRDLGASDAPSSRSPRIGSAGGGDNSNRAFAHALDPGAPTPRRRCPRSEEWAGPAPGRSRLAARDPAQ